MSAYANDPRVDFLPNGLVRVYPHKSNYCEYYVHCDPWGKWHANYDDGLRDGPVKHACLKASLDDALHALIGDPR